MKLSLAEQPRVRKALAPKLRLSALRAAPEPIEVVVVDEHHRPVEIVPGATALRIAGREASIKADLPVLPGSRLLVQVGPRYAVDAWRKRWELEVVGCKKQQRGHHVVARVVESHVSAARKAA